MNVIGISAFYHDSACCVIKDGKLIAAAQEERFSRKKNDARIPNEAFLYCLSEGKLSIKDIDCLAYYENPTKKLARQLWARQLPISALDTSKVLSFKKIETYFRQQFGFDGLIKFYDHHLSHAASSYFFSGFKNAGILTVDGVGEWATTSYCFANENKINVFEEVDFPDSLGLLYSTITSYLGFEVNEGEYKVMGLAPYGKPIYVNKVKSLIKSHKNGQYKLMLEYFDFLNGNRMYSDKLIELFGSCARERDSDILEFHCDVAKSLQVILQEILLEKVNYLYQHVESENLCMAGGVALNCVANSYILKNSKFKRMFVQPAANDAGGALGAAALAYNDIAGNFANKRLEDVYLGPSYSSASIKMLLESSSIKYHDYTGRSDELIMQTSKRLSEGKILGWFNGRMEFGPRSLGARSILADPRDQRMRDKINSLVKRRESFRPFAPVVLEEKALDHFDIDHPSPFMLETCQVISKQSLPAITHVDNSARIQTVKPMANVKLTKLLNRFEELTGCSVLLNTSFNVKGEPIVCTPEDAILCFIKNNLDCLVIEDFLIDSVENNFQTLKWINTDIVKTDGFEVNREIYTFI